MCCTSINGQLIARHTPDLLFAIYYRQVDGRFKHTVGLRVNLDVHVRFHLAQNLQVFRFGFPFQFETRRGAILCRLVTSLLRVRRKPSILGLRRSLYRLRAYFLVGADCSYEYSRSGGHHWSGTMNTWRNTLAVVFTRERGFTTRRICLLNKRPIRCRDGKSTKLGVINTS